ncbi:MAG: glycosyltransferase [Deltaproteobacteria bacterium]|nr:glycosyltransferase [Deltaproteobacteria bacterium]
MQPGAVEHTTLGVAVVAVVLAVHLILTATAQVLFLRRRRSYALCRREILGSPPVVRDEPCVGLVSVLKPLAGMDDDLDENLASFARQEGVDFEIVFGVASSSDPALVAARRFLQAHPSVEARIVITDPDAAINPKVAQLIALERHARGQILVTSDSNVRVRSDYLRSLVAPLDEPRCGLVTSVFAGTGERTLGAALENLQLSAVIAPFVVLSTLGLPVTIGKSMAMRARDLRELGGFASFGDVLAEDLMIGRRFADAGFRVATSFSVIENRNVSGSLARMFDRHSRWAKMRRIIVPGFFAIEPLFSPIVTATLVALAMPSRVTVGMLVATIALQTLASLVAAWSFRGRPLPWRYLPLEIVRTFMMVACWASAWVSRTVVWRGNPLELGPNTTVTRPAAPDSARGVKTAA